MASQNNIFSLIVFIFLINYSKCKDTDREMTVEVRPGTEQCFYETIKAGETLDIEYQVVDGGQGELDINFYIASPQGTILVHDIQKAEGAHRTTMSDEGDYRICWDNGFSTFNSKTVFFAMIVDNDDDDDDYDQWDGGFDSAVTGEEVYEMKIDDIKDAMDRIRAHLHKSRFLQDQLRAYEARDRNIAENNFLRVNNWSLMNIVVMIVTGLIQVVLLRSLFDEKSKLHRLWKNGPNSPFS